MFQELRLKDKDERSNLTKNIVTAAPVTMSYTLKTEM